ncbi:MAG: hypothetical protein EPN93_11190 [Spirochaetes bacterium]|nr:MAG: hypothetical protein EPN93_11190 [Spirochaetota bacterium]
MSGVVKYKDHRSGRVVFISQCIANQNLRFPGIAVTAGVCRELVEMLAAGGAGIETIPCLERIGWGGIARTGFIKYQPYLLARHRAPVSRIITLFARLWLWNYGRRCGREAAKIVSCMEDYLRQGYVIDGIISVDDSPTDGVTHTIDLLRSSAKIRSGTFDAGKVLSADISLMKEILPALCERGEGIFMRTLKARLKKKAVQVKIIGFDPWADQGAEAERISKELNLYHTES